MTPEQEAEALELEIAIEEEAAASGAGAPFAGTPETFRQQQYGEPAPSTVKSRAMNTFQGLGDAATLGWLDEGAAAIVAMHPDITYDQAYSIAKKNLDTAKQDPQSYLLGGLLGGGATGAAAAPRSALGMLGIGAGEGALYGAGSAEEGERGQGTQMGAGVGAAISTLFPTVGAIYNFYRSGRGAKQPTIAGELIQKSIDASGKTPQQIQATAQQMGPKSTSFANAAGDAGAGTARGVSQQDPLARRIIKEAVEGQTAGAKNRVNETLGTMTSRKGDYWTDQKALQATQRANAEKLYPGAMSKDILPEEPMLKVMANPAVSKAWREAQELAAMEGRTLPKLYDYDETGKAFFTGERMPTMAELQYLDQYLGSSIKGLKQSAKMGTDATAANRGRIMGNVRRDLNEAIRQQNPEYGQAKKVFAGDQAVRDSLDLGRKAATTNINDRMETIAGMSQSEKDAYLQGIISDFRHRLGSTEADKAVSLNFMNNENMAETITALMPQTKEGKASAKKLFDRLKAESRYKRTAQAAIGGSQTADNLAIGSQVGQQAADAYSTVAGPTATVIDEMINFVTKPNIKKETWRELATLLATPGKTEEALKLARQAGATTEQLKAMMQASRTAAAAAVPVGGQAATAEY